VRAQPADHFRATLHYDGAEFHGWQIQPELRTVQGDVEACLTRLCAGPVRVHAAGRTDAGVHACGQEVAFRAPGWDADELARALNATLPPAVWAEQVRPASEGFHPRFQATGRRYEYLVGTSADAGSPLRRTRLWAVSGPIAEDVLGRVTQLSVGERSFEKFARSGQPERSTVCRIERAEWNRTSAGDLRLLLVADRFLHHMVRYLVHTFVAVALGRRSEREARAMLAAKDGERPPQPAPACGLYLTGVRYAEGWNRAEGIPGVV